MKIVKNCNEKSYQNYVKNRLKGCLHMLGKKHLFNIFLISYLFISPFMISFAQGKEFLSVSNLIVTGDDLGLCGSYLIDNQLHFIGISDHKDSTKLSHFFIEDGEVVEKELLEEKGFYPERQYFFTSTMEKSFYFAYALSVKNETTQEYNREFWCYYYNSTSNESQKIFLIDGTNYLIDYRSTPSILGVNILDNNQAIYLLTSYNILGNKTDIIVFDLNQTKKTTNKYIEYGMLEDISSCYNPNNNSAYFLYFDTGKDNYRLYEYDFLTHSLTNYSNCSFSNPGYNIKGSIRVGRLLYNQLTDNIYLLCTLSASTSSPTEFALFEYNSTSSTFNLTSVSESAYVTLNTRIDPNVRFYTYKGLEIFDAYIHNSQLSIIYRKSTAHSEFRQIALINYSLTINGDWNYINLNLESNLNPFHSRFIYNCTSNSYLDSYLLGYAYNDHSQYHSFGGDNNIISSLGIYGIYANDISKPYFIRAIKSPYYWLIITSSIIIPIIFGGVGYYYFHRYKKKQKSREEN